MEAEVHSFDPSIAQRVGVNAAVIYQNIVWWCQKNAANSHNEREGRHWTFNSLSAWSQLFPYMTAKQIRTALENLEEECLVLTGVFNNHSFDRTKWYSPADAPDLPLKANADVHLPSGANADVHLPSGANPICPTGQITSAPEGKCLTVSKPDIKPDEKTHAHRDAASDCADRAQWDLTLFEAEGQSLTSTKAKKQKFAGGLYDGCQTIADEFERVWAKHPRKVGKDAALKAWAMAREKTEFMTIAGPLAQWMKFQSGTPTDKIPHFTTWLNQGRWKDDQTHARNRAETTSDRIDRLGEISTEAGCDQIAGPQRKLPEIDLRID